ncbi:unnamed protein product [Arctogadus glacialis]
MDQTMSPQRREKLSGQSGNNKNLLKIPGVVYVVSGVVYVVSGVVYDVSGVVYDVVYDVSGVVYDVSGVVYDVSGVVYDVSGVVFGLCQISTDSAVCVSSFPSEPGWGGGITEPSADVPIQRTAALPRWKSSGTRASLGRAVQGVVPPPATGGQDGAAGR